MVVVGGTVGYVHESRSPRGFYYIILYALQTMNTAIILILLYFCIGLCIGSKVVALGTCRKTEYCVAQNILVFICNS